MNTQQTRHKAPFVDIPARDFKRKFNDSRPRFAVNHDESIRNLIPLRSDNLEADGCAFACALDWLMTFAGYSEAPRSFVRAVAGVIERDEDGNGKRMAITDDRLAELMNCSTKTVQRQRKLYLEQERGSEKVRATNFSILAVIEGEFDHATQKHAPNVYEFLVGKQAAQAVERARTSPEWKRDQFKAMREATREVFNDIDEAPLASTKRKKKTLSPESEARRIRQTMVSLAKRLGEQTRQIKDPDTLANLKLDELQSDIEEAMFSGDLRQAFVTKEVDPPTGQNVHQPPVSDAVLEQEERMRTASTPLDVATSGVWANIENRLRREQPIDESLTDISEDVDDIADNIPFPGESPDELTYELDADEIAERDAIQAEACGLPMNADEITQPPPPTTNANAPPLDDEDAAYRYFDDLINERAGGLMKTQGMRETEAGRTQKRSTITGSHGKVRGEKTSRGGRLYGMGEKRRETLLLPEDAPG
jgi:hypothetical protein